MNKDELKWLIVEFHEMDLPDSIERDMDIDLSTDKVIALVGPPRAGKTYQLYIVRGIVARRVPSEQSGSSKNRFR